MPSINSGTFRRDCSLEGFLEEGVRRSRALEGGLHERKGSEGGEPVTCGQAGRQGSGQLRGLVAQARLGSLVLTDLSNGSFLS